MNQTAFLNENTLPPGMQHTNQIRSYEVAAISNAVYRMAAMSQDFIKHKSACFLSIIKKIVIVIRNCVINVSSKIKEVIMLWAPTIGPPINAYYNNIAIISQPNKVGAELFCALVI